MSDTEEGDRDAAWVVIPSPLSPGQLHGQLRDLERILRLNSGLDIHEWQPLAEDRVRLRGHNLTNDRPILVEIRLYPEPNGWRLEYAEGLKTETKLAIEAEVGNSARLRITDDYSGYPLQKRQAKLAEVDHSLPQWGRDLARYFKAWHRWSWFPPWRWFMHRVWIPMRPSARRITRLILWISLGELLLLFLFLMIQFGLQKAAWWQELTN